MPDGIRFIQRVIGKLTGHRELFAITPEYYGREGVEPSPLRERQTRLGRLLGVRLFSRAYPGVVGRVHVHDSMLRDDSPEEIAHYIRVGNSAMENIEAALAAAGRSWAGVRACLDMACGYGRVLRLLQTRVAPRAITACDLDAEAVRFLAAEFRITPIVSQRDLRNLRLPGEYDLIWVGSLLTNIPPGACYDALERVAGRLSPGGVLVFSTQGERCLEKLAYYGWMFEPQEEEFRRQLAEEGMAYAPYYPKADPGYGITLIRRGHLEGWMAEKFGSALRPVRFAEAGWDAHQDVWAYQRAGD